MRTDPLEDRRRPGRVLLVACAVGVGALLFVVSLFFDAVRYERVDRSSLEMLLFGWLGPLGMHIGWYANPLLLLSWGIAFVPRRIAAYAALVASIGALGVGLSSYYTLAHMGMFGRHEGEMAGALLSYRAGIFLWTASLATGLLAAMASLVFAPRRPRWRPRMTLRL